MVLAAVGTALIVIIVILVLAAIGLLAVLKKVL
jgi:hypothetical protein